MTRTQATRTLRNALRTFSRSMLNTARSIKMVVTDPGTDCDDQAYLKKVIESMNPEFEELVFVISGPVAQKAAFAVAEKYFDKCGRYPLIALAQSVQHNAEASAYSLVDGSIISDFEKFKDAQEYICTLPELQKKIDQAICEGLVEEFDMVVIAPLSDEKQVYDPKRSDVDPKYREILPQKFKGLEKRSVAQFFYDKDGVFKGFNHLNSSPQALEKYFSVLNSGFTEVYVDGVIAKNKEFQLAVEQPDALGIQKAIEAYISFSQLPWLNFPGEKGHMPQENEMHFGMFLEGAQFPFCSHASGLNPAGFGLNRFLKEVMSCDENNPNHQELAKKINEKLNAFDEKVFQKFKTKFGQVENVDDLRKLLHAEMMRSLRDVAAEYGVKDLEEINSIKDVFTHGKDVKLMDFKTKFFERLYKNNLVHAVSEIAEETKKEKTNDLTFAQDLMQMLIPHNPRATVFDAVTASISEEVFRNAELKNFFKVLRKIPEGGVKEVVSVTNEKMKELKEVKPELHQLLVDKVRSDMQGMRMAEPTQATRSAQVKVNQTCNFL